MQVASSCSIQTLSPNQPLFQTSFYSIPTLVPYPGQVVSELADSMWRQYSTDGRDRGDGLPAAAAAVGERWGKLPT